MTDLPRPDVILDIVEEHFEELDFLWEQRESVVFAPDWYLEDLAEHEERCEAHLDGLRLAGGHSIDIARPALAGDERGAATAATLVFVALGTAELDAEVLEAFATVEEAARDGIRIGLRHSDIGRVASQLTQLASQGDPSLRIAALDVLAFHRMAPPANVRGLLSESGTHSHALLYSSLGRFGGPWEIEYLREALDSEPAAAQRAALEASARVGLRDLAGTCRRAATTSASPSALEFLGVVGGSEDLPVLREAIDEPSVAEAALAGLGALGSVAVIPELIEMMRDDALTVPAGAAFRRITGADDIDADEPLPAPEDLLEDEAEFHEPIVPSDAEKAEAWWEAQRDRFKGAGPWQAGRNLGDGTTADSVRVLTLESRRDLFLRCRSREGSDTPDRELEARVAKQLAEGRR